MPYTNLEEIVRNRNHSREGVNFYQAKKDWTEYEGMDLLEGDTEVSVSPGHKARAEVEAEVELEVQVKREE